MGGKGFAGGRGTRVRQLQESGGVFAVAVRGLPAAAYETLLASEGLFFLLVFLFCVRSFLLS